MHTTDQPYPDFTRLSLIEIRRQLESLAREVRNTFGVLAAGQLNWRPDTSSWSVAQCLDHLVRTNELMFREADETLTGVHRQTLWQHMPLVHSLFGRMLIRSLSPSSAKKFTASPAALPATSDVSPDVIDRFVEQHRMAAVQLENADEHVAARRVMTSPFARVMTYSVLDGWRLVVAHDWRHLEQARRVIHAAGFPQAA